MIAQGHDPTQVGLLTEDCLLVSDKDEIIGSATKYQCHMNSNIQQGMIHRAFSVFLFNEKNELLLQRRSMKKITFPGLYTNACCSHPVAVPQESCGILGVRRAAQRRLYQELGLSIPDESLDSLSWITRIYYQAQSDSNWGEREIDYVLFLRLQQPALNPNSNEVMETLYISPKDLDAWISSDPNAFTPWFRLISKHLLFQWWDNLAALDQQIDCDTIHDFTGMKI